MNFNEKLMELRRSKGLSQEQLGEMLGVTRQTVSKWELGSTTPEMEKLAAICDIFGITADELIRGESPKAEEEVLPQKEKPRSLTSIHWEYKSNKSWRGLPLIHINIGFGAYKAKGVVAIGNCAKGIVAVGLAALGVVSLGLLSLGILAHGLFTLGVLSFGAVAAGLAAFGGIAAGIIAFGGVSAGWFAVGGLSFGAYAIGGSANAALIAAGGAAAGQIAIGEKTAGELCINAAVKAEEFRSMALTLLPDTPDFILNIFASLAENLRL
ncbi:MAG: helix-turn-helix domain-containing protein [Ruminiclostridium sp.]